MKDQESDNIKKFRHTFSRIIPDLKMSRGVIVFLCKKPPNVLVYSIVGGELVFEKVKATEVISALMKFKCRQIPWNIVSNAKLKQIIRSFDYISEIEKDKDNQNDQKKIKALRKEIERIYKEKYKP